jgi:hypothetical protein
MDPRAVARTLGRRGGLARARRLSPAERQRIASLGGHARRRSLEIATRIAETLDYAAAARDLRRRSPRVRRLRRFRGPLPGIYSGRT